MAGLNVEHGRQFGMGREKEEEIAGMSILQHFPKTERAAGGKTEDAEKHVGAPQELQPVGVGSSPVGKGQHVREGKPSLAHQGTDAIPVRQQATFHSQPNEDRIVGTGQSDAKLRGEACISLHQ